jgi:protein involved in sex pheromone biosynthesis
MVTPDNNDYWETLDYSKELGINIVQTVYMKNVTAKTIQQIIKTSQPNYGLTEACLYELAQVEDILDCLNRISQELKPAHIYLFIEIVDNLLTLKRDQLNSYLQTTYNVDTGHMTKTQITDMLNIFPSSLKHDHTL